MDIRELTTETISSWDQLVRLEQTMEFGTANNVWLFRGQASVDWLLESTFDRSLPANPEKKPWEYEAAILREFTRRAHHYIIDLPKSADILEWFSLMRHYGAPSRLVDFTYSFYVAAYFAVKNVTPGGPAAVWAIKQSWLNEKIDSAFPKEDRKGDYRFKDPKDFYRHFLNYQHPHDFVGVVNPFRMNQRLTAQQGVFLCPGNIAWPFWKNLRLEDDDNAKNKIVRIPLAATMKTEAIRHLWRMNVNSATLYPDLSGFAQSLADWFVLPMGFNKKDLKSAIRGRVPGI